MEKGYNPLNIKITGMFYENEYADQVHKLRNIINSIRNVFASNNIPMVKIMFEDSTLEDCCEF